MLKCALSVVIIVILCAGPASASGLKRVGRHHPRSSQTAIGRTGNSQAAKMMMLRARLAQASALRNQGLTGQGQAGRDKSGRGVAAKSGNGKGAGGGKKKRDPAQFFAKLDTNNDGKVSLDEMKARGKDAAKAAEHFKHLDKNGDGFITRDELQMRKKK